MPPSENVSFAIKPSRVEILGLFHFTSLQFTQYLAAHPDLKSFTGRWIHFDSPCLPPKDCLRAHLSDPLILMGQAPCDPNILRAVTRDP
jgi:hypothetical protein